MWPKHQNNYYPPTIIDTPPKSVSVLATPDVFECSSVGESLRALAS